MPSTPSAADAAPRRRWPLAEKRRIVELTLQPDASVQSIAEKYHLDPPTLSKWRNLYRKGSLDILPDAKKAQKRQAEFLPVMIHAAPAMRKSVPAIVTMQMPNGITLKIEAETIDFASLGSFLAGINP